ncbi:hypothetical protein ACOSQ4_013929 [Xanthoceras sorbifolium]
MTRDGDNRRNTNNGGARRTTADKQCKGSTRVEEDERWKSSGATRRAADKRGENIKGRFCLYKIVMAIGIEPAVPISEPPILVLFFVQPEPGPRGAGGGGRGGGKWGNRRFRFLPGFFGAAGSKTRTGPNKKNFEFFL